MKVAITLISSLLMGLMLKGVIESRRRLLASVVFACMAFVFVMAAILLSSVDLALQYEAQGFLLWNAILGIATVFAVTGLILALAAKVVFPKPTVENSLSALGDASSVVNMVTQFAQGFAAGQTAPPHSASPFAERPVTPPQETTLH